MDGLVLGYTAVFIGAVIALYASRKRTEKWIRFVLMGVILASITVGGARVAKLASEREKVWHPQAIPWAKAPLGVYWNGLDFLDYNPTLHEGMTTWNRRVGCTIFQPAVSRGQAQIVLKMMDGRRCGSEVGDGHEVWENPDAPVSAWFCGGWFEIQVKRIDDVGIAFRIALHELGHAVGLDHDETGAMSPEVFKPRAGEPPEYLLPSEKDVEAIRERFCN